MTTTPIGATDEGPRVIGRPIFVFLSIFPFGFALDHWLRLPDPVPADGLIHWANAAIGVGLIAIGLALFIAGIRNFSRAGTAVPTNEPARNLVTTGVHGRTRNPVYVGFILLTAGVGLVIRSPWLLILAVLFAMYLRYGVIAREEAYLERRFGNPYRDYQARVRRWF